MSYYCHYNEHPQYRCSTCGRRCGANGHSGCGNAELINGFPALFTPFALGLVWVLVGLVVQPLAWFTGVEWVAGLWWTLGKIIVGLSFVVAVLGTVVGAGEKKKHKQDKDAIDQIIFDGATNHKTADVISREIKEYYEGK